MHHRTTVRGADLIGGIVSAGLGDRTARERAEAIVTLRVGHLRRLACSASHFISSRFV